MTVTTEQRVPANKMNAGWVFRVRSAWWMPVRIQPNVHVVNGRPVLNGWIFIAVQVPEGHVPDPGPMGGWFVPDDTPRRTFLFGLDVLIKAFPPPPHPDDNGAVS